MLEEKFFYDLLKETKLAFDKSPIKRYQIENGKSWYYAVCDSPIVIKRGVIFGLNWGESKDGDDKAQTVYPYDAEKKRDWNFASTSKRYFQDHLGINHIGEVNYSNLCFFRSKNIDPIKPEDWKLSLPLFESYINYIQPKWCVLLGNTGVDILKKHCKISDLKRMVYQGEKRRTFGYNGKLFDTYKFYAVPHPQSRLSPDARKSIWTQLFEGSDIKPF